MSKRKMKLQELDDAFILVRSRLQNEADHTSDNYYLYLRQLKNLEKIDAYVSTYEWVSKTQEVKDKVKFIRESGYDYELCRRELKLSADGLKGLIKRANKSFVEKVGESTIDLVISRNNTVGLGMTQFGICSGKYKLSEILNKDFYEMLPEAKIDFFNIFDCEEEIRTMYFNSQFGMKSLLDKCSPEKFAFLRYILENPTERYIEEQKDLISLLLGVNIDFDTYFSNLAALKAEKMNQTSEYYSSYLVNASDNAESDFESDLDGYSEFEGVVPDENEEQFVPLSESEVDAFVRLDDNEFDFFKEEEFASLRGSEDDSEGESDDFAFIGKNRQENEEDFISLFADKDFELDETLVEEEEDEVLEDL